MRIKEQRKALGISQTKLGEFCGVTKGTISQYENGKREPDLTTLKKIAAALHCTVDYLLGIDDDNGNSEFVVMIEKLDENELQELSAFVDYLVSKRGKTK